ncbi:MAG: hypothetical protein HC936_10055 [Leptolyngbyaceae cyanobacterium SU_3_3]|nr:hypothetical protein [Leptolyngbyaceae cyanobacterium SU_3_3]NJR52374.1 hypothetical protein [Leptolyngbyaceae cyanobacterium CSU_1_3]
MQLIYRSQTIEFTPGSALLQNKSHAINWRFQIPGKPYSIVPVLKRSDRQLHAVNWRFRITTAD